MNLNYIVDYKLYRIFGRKEHGRKEGREGGKKEEGKGKRAKQIIRECS